MNIAERLKRETAAAHRRIEELVSLEARVACVASYRALIVRFYGFYTEWEPRLATILGADVFDAKRRKIELLRRDLRALGLRSRDIDALPVCPCPIRADESMRALGALYQSMKSLGGQTVASLSPAFSGSTHLSPSWMSVPKRMIVNGVWVVFFTSLWNRQR